MNVGLDLEKCMVFFDVTVGMSTVTATMNSKTARAVAAQLLSSAETLENALEEGLIKESD